MADLILRDNEAAFRLGDSDAVFFRRLEPEGYGFFSIRDRFSSRVPVRHTTGKLRHIHHEGVILGAPPDDHFVTRCFHLAGQRSDRPLPLKLARCPHSLAASLAALPSMSLIPSAPFLDCKREWIESRCETEMLWQG